MSSNENQGGKVLSNEELTKVVVNHILENLEEQLDGCGHIGVSFPYTREGVNADDLPENMALLKVDKDGKGELTVVVGVSREGTDRLYSNYLFEAGNTFEEVRAWLANLDACVPVILDSVKELSASVDEYWD